MTTYKQQTGGKNSSLQDKKKQLNGLLDPKVLVDAINQAVTTNLKISSQLMSKGGAASNGTGFVSKPHLGKPRQSQLAPVTDGSLNQDLECQYCKDTDHLKDNCIMLNCQLAWSRRMLLPTKVCQDQNWQTRDSFV